VKKSALIASLALVATPALSAPAAPPKPKLIVAIAVDQFSADLFNEYRTQFTGGLKRLASGIVFPAGYQSHAATETCPGHSTILTGSRPSRTGIIANDWQDPAHPRVGAGGKPSYDVYCAEDPSATPAAGSPYVVSSRFLRVPTLGDRLKQADPASRSVAISGKDRAAVMMGGHKTDLTLWWDGKAFVTYAGKQGDIPPAITAVNARASAVITKGSAATLPASCQSHNYPTPINATASVGQLQPRKPGDGMRWRASPDFDRATLDASLATISALKLGKGAATDLLAISFSATDYVGHLYGTEGAEQCSNLMALDFTLGKLFSELDKGGAPYVVVLTADHGGHDLTERNRSNGLPSAERVDPQLTGQAIGTLVAKQLGLRVSALIGRGAFGDIYLAPDVPADKRDAVLKAAVATYQAHRQVAAAFTKAELLALPSPTGRLEDWSLAERARASLDAERSGDLIILLKPYVMPIPSASAGYVATHGSPYGYDRRVPILFWWKGAAHFEQPNGVETADIMPTLASLIELPVPQGDIDGRCLDLIPGEGSNCR
jgi:predicted AlkP superfamily pyrophosphatase or phosphodiesterase